MDILEAIKGIFRKNNGSENESVVAYHWYSREQLAAIQHHLKDAENKVPQLEGIYGQDFASFFYATGIEKTIRTAFLETLDVAIQYRNFLDKDHWSDKHPFNFPGTFYTGETDTCGTGDGEAPFNVLYDEHCCEYIFKQPQNYAELVCVVDAAYLEVYGGYSCNGNDHWTYTACKNWWSNRSDIIVGLYDNRLQEMNGGREKMYIDYLKSPAAEMDLRKYCYFLEHHCYPANDQVKLPTL
ncbi:hypothetical protein [Chitinophaga sp. RAB17]|uniref:hypothetical protein n=1 Tax=Chitinophaga sp. RAB17 TaxID=3233049 RepID=UPI003F93F4FE